MADDEKENKKAAFNPSISKDVISNQFSGEKKKKKRG